MQFFPHNVPISITNTAVSASLTQTAQFLYNLGTIAINTASLALNMSGSTGASGSNYTKTGATGPQGSTGPTGYRGNSVYLLSIARSTGSNTVCYTTDALGTATFNGVNYTCNYGFAQTYYANASSLTNGVVLYYDSSCSSLAVNLSSLSDPTSNAIFNTDGAGTITLTGNNCASSI